MSMKTLQEVLACGSDGQKMSAQEYEQLKSDSYNEKEGTLNLDDGYDCRECKNKGYISIVKDYGLYFSETLIPCKCQRIREAINRLKRSGLKNIVKEYTFDKYDSTEKWQKRMKQAAMKFCKEDAEAENHWLFIGGQSGCGKTHLCTATAVVFIKKGYNVRYMLWRDEISKIKSRINESEEHEAMMKELKEADVLYIDDLFKSGKGEDGKPKTPTAADINIAFEILNYRYNNPQLVTIISSELTVWDLCDIDEALAGRISERTKASGYCMNIKKDISRNWRLRDLQEI